MVAAVSAAMHPPPPYPVHEFLKFAGMSAAGATRFMESHQLIAIEGMFFFNREIPRRYEDLQRAANTPDGE